MKRLEQAQLRIRALGRALPLPGRRPAPALWRCLFSQQPGLSVEDWRHMGLQVIHAWGPMRFLLMGSEVLKDPAALATLRFAHRLSCPVVLRLELSQELTPQQAMEWVAGGVSAVQWEQAGGESIEPMETLHRSAQILGRELPQILRSAEEGLASEAAALGVTLHRPKRSGLWRRLQDAPVGGLRSDGALLGSQLSEPLEEPRSPFVPSATPSLWEQASRKQSQLRSSDPFDWAPLELMQI